MRSQTHRLCERRRRTCATALLLAVAVVVLYPALGVAHPADRLLQHSLISVSGDGVTVDLAISGGLLAVEGIARRIDADADGVFAPDEAQVWLADFLGHLHVTSDGAPITPDPSAVSLALPDPTRFQLGLAPLSVRFSLPIAVDDTTLVRADLQITNSYLLDITDFRVDVFTGPGGTVHGAVTPGKTLRLLVEIDPTQRGGGAPIAASERWSASGVVAEANDLLSRERTPQFVVAMLAVFVVMGGLHALQPGHGKTLVAAWLVATGGTPRDAIALAGIVTLTHTLSVFLLGGATVLASQWFLPSRVIPALGVVSGLLVAGMGAQMLRRSTGTLRASHRAKYSRSNTFRSTLHASVGEPSVGDPSHAGPRSRHSHDHHELEHHHHEHDHDLLDEEAHARAHLADLERVYGFTDGRRRVSMRQLVTLGVSGGIAPCPDALAILLLAIGIGQAAFGMIAIIAFSLGLSVVLVAFGLTVALAGPAWRHARQTAGERRGARMDRLTTPLGHFAAISPTLSALVVLGLGIGLLWKSLGL